MNFLLLLTIISLFYNSVHSALRGAQNIYTEAALNDMVTNLPGLKDTLTFNQFSGYLVTWHTLTKDIDPVGNRSTYS
jgi:hypothetical protein